MHSPVVASSKCIETPWDRSIMRNLPFQRGSPRSPQSLALCPSFTFKGGILKTL